VREALRVALVEGGTYIHATEDGRWTLCGRRVSEVCNAPLELERDREHLCGSCLRSLGGKEVKS